MVAARGTFRQVDGEAVEMADAKAVWVPLAREALVRTAHEYHGLIKYGELAEEIQQRSGIRTKQLVHYWIGDILGQVATDCHERKEPLLSALCVQQNGSIGDGYAVALAATYGGSPPDDLDMSAAEERLACYRFFGATIPDDGGRPALTPQVALQRRKAAKRAREDFRRPVCPGCFLELPATGQCDNCVEAK